MTNVSIQLRSLDNSDLAAATALLSVSCSFDRAGEVTAEKLFGPAPGVLKADTLGAFEGTELVGLVVNADRWIRLLAVRPDRRRRGIGTMLLAAAESGIAGRGHDRARTMDEPGNYLAPGIDERNRETLAWIERRGYRRLRDNTNLLIAVVDNPRVSESLSRARDQACAARGYRVRRATPADAPTLCDWVGHTFSAGWAFEVERALGNRPAGVHVAEAGETVCAFAAHDGNNRGLGWFGPAGTAAAARGGGLGAALLIRCLLDVAGAGHQHCEVSWIGPRAFYDSVAGIAAERHFVVLDKEVGA